MAAVKSLHLFDTAAKQLGSKIRSAEGVDPRTPRRTPRKINTAKLVSPEN